MNLLRIFTNQNRWIKNARARYKDGSLVPFTIKYGEKEKEPWSFSLYGAVSFYASAESETRDRIMAKLSQAIEIYTGKSMYVAEFNDSMDTSFEDLIAVLKIYNKILKS